jgi:branched-chain amino acid transport system ATP-binding protein
MGIARTFQQVGIFSSLSVEDNIAVGALAQYHIPVIPEILGMKAAVEPRARLAQRSREIAELCGLDRQSNKAAGTLPLGLQKRIELARALATNPAILLLDEPAGGLSHREIDEFLDLLVNIKKSLGLTIIMIEHHLGLVMRASDHIIVLNFGLKIAEGTATEVRKHPEVISAYIGAGA